MRTCIYTRCTGTSTLLHSLDTQDIDAHNHTHTRTTLTYRDTYDETEMPTYKLERGTHAHTQTNTHTSTHTCTHTHMANLSQYTHIYTHNTLSWLDCHNISWNTGLSVVHVS